ncbi:hypothetical protein BDV95DRAFT_589949 [Massariosphaeria phaeospora]|uniref:Uncharacterized protein n=1 Tax=Massariosphaeria phaeospora TaxID=100035 RepID=A0A7C8MIR1_9PLEO|nr:hypothetical protein BDV95DRAFT_589949 [Massariosphaeria phaeospora]
MPNMGKRSGLPLNRKREPKPGNGKKSWLLKTVNDDKEHDTEQFMDWDKFDIPDGEDGGNNKGNGDFYHCYCCIEINTGEDCLTRYGKKGLVDSKGNKHFAAYKIPASIGKGSERVRVCPRAWLQYIRSKEKVLSSCPGVTLDWPNHEWITFLRQENIDIEYPRIDVLPKGKECLRCYAEKNHEVQDLIGNNSHILVPKLKHWKDIPMFEFEEWVKPVWNEEWEKLEEPVVLADGSLFWWSEVPKEHRPREIEERISSKGTTLFIVTEDEPELAETARAHLTDNPWL